MAKKIVQATDLSKVYNQGLPNEVWALKDVNLEIDAGEFLVIMGPSGSGKTTLLNCISGIDNASAGVIDIDGEDLQTMSDRKKTSYRARKMGFIFQTFNLIPVLSALENVEMPLLVTGVSTRAARKSAIEMLDKVGLADRLHHKPSELSGGQRQRVTIARALVHKPSVIWADEPTGNLDTETAASILELMHKLNKEEEETFVVVTHDQGIADQADRVVHIRNGQVEK